MKYSAALDGLRALSALAVLTLHSSYGQFQGGVFGVDVFFAISGFLITTNLVADVDRYDRIKFREFYLRRARRLLPALAATLLLAWWLWPKAAVPYAQAALPTLLYFANWRFVFDGSASLGPLAHAWSLSIEEQFYAVWPITLMVVVLIARRHKGRAATLTALMVVALASFRAFLSLSGSPFGTKPSTFARLDELLVGGAFALGAGTLRPPRWLAYASAAGLLGVVFSSTDDARWLYLGGFTLVAVMAAAVVTFVIKNPAESDVQGPKLETASRGG